MQSSEKIDHSLLVFKFQIANVQYMKYPELISTNSPKILFFFFYIFFIFQIVYIQVVKKYTGCLRKSKSLKGKTSNQFFAK